VLEFFGLLNVGIAGFWAMLWWARPSRQAAAAAGNGDFLH
jgi:hypothetical protein